MGVTCDSGVRDTSAKGPPVHDALELNAGGDLALIRLGDQHYTLRVTRAGKLILTK